MTKIVRDKISRTLETGFKCAKCLYETVVFGENEFAPEQCLNCQTPGPVQVWQTTVINRATTEVTNPMQPLKKR